jgi:hypothetical protein
LVVLLGYQQETGPVVLFLLLHKMLRLTLILLLLLE